MSRASTLATLAAAALLGAGALWTQVLAAHAERRFPPEGRFVGSGRSRLHVVERGAGSPVVLLHGAFGGVQDWTSTGILDALARNHRVLAFDRPGHGWSDEAASGAPAPLGQARLLRAALRASGVERPLLVGFSYGGAVALAWAVEYPDEIAGVLTVNGVAYPWPGATDTPYVLAGIPVLGPLLAYTVAAPFGALTADEAVERAFAPSDVPPTFARSPIALALRPAQFQTEARDMRLLKTAVAIQSTRYGEIRAPLEILAARGDRVAFWDFHSERLSRAVPGARLTVLEAGGHQVLHSDPRAVIEAVERLAARAAAR